MGLGFFVWVFVAALSLSFLVCESVRLHLKVLQQHSLTPMTHAEEEGREGDAVSHVKWFQEEQLRRKRHKMLLQQHTSLHRLLALAFSFTSENTFVGPRLQIDAATAAVRLRIAVFTSLALDAFFSSGKASKFRGLFPFVWCSALVRFCGLSSPKKCRRSLFVVGEVAWPVVLLWFSFS